MVDPSPQSIVPVRLGPENARSSCVTPQAVPAGSNTMVIGVRS